jgi:hypothetical protein
VPKIAAAFNVSMNMVEKWKMAGFPRYPREGWEAVLAELSEREADKGIQDAHERAEVLQEQAEKLWAEAYKGERAYHPKRERLDDG